MLKYADFFSKRTMCLIHVRTEQLGPMVNSDREAQVVCVVCPCVRKIIGSPTRLLAVLGDRGAVAEIDVACRQLLLN